MALIKGKALWAKIQTPDTKFEPTGVWSIDLIPEDQGEIDTFESNGFKIRLDNEGNKTVRFQRKCINKKSGQPNRQPVCVDAHMKPVDDLIGNGSDVVVQYDAYHGSNSFGTYQGLELKGVQVLNLISYGGADGDEFTVFDAESEF